MSVPLEVIAAPLTLYVAPVGTNMPDVSAVPDVTWVKLGTSGSKNYSEKGVIVTHNQTIVTWKPAGGTGARKAWRTEEFVTVEAELADLNIAQYAKLLNDATVTTTGNHKSIQLQQGATVATFALLARGISASVAGLKAQYFVPLCFQEDSPAPAYAGAGVPAMLACKFQALEDSSLGFGEYDEQIT